MFLGLQDLLLFPIHVTWRQLANEMWYMYTHLENVLWYPQVDSSAWEQGYIPWSHVIVHPIVWASYNSNSILSPSSLSKRGSNWLPPVLWSTSPSVRTETQCWIVLRGGESWGVLGWAAHMMLVTGWLTSSETSLTRMNWLKDCIPLSTSIRKHSLLCVKIIFLYTRSI